MIRFVMLMTGLLFIIFMQGRALEFTAANTAVLRKMSIKLDMWQAEQKEYKESFIVYQKWHRQLETGRKCAQIYVGKPHTVIPHPEALKGDLTHSGI